MANSLETGHASANGIIGSTVAAERGFEAKMADRPAVAVVDDDESVRESLPDLLKEFGFSVRTFSSAEEFLASGCIDQITCLILDNAMPGITGLELQRQLRGHGQVVPIILITGQG